VSQIWLSVVLGFDVDHVAANSGKHLLDRGSVKAFWNGVEDFEAGQVFSGVDKTKSGVKVGFLSKQAELLAFPNLFFEAFLVVSSELLLIALLLAFVQLLRYKIIKRRLPGWCRAFADVGY
jgi:hypothetical protein